MRTETNHFRTFVHAVLYYMAQGKTGEQVAEMADLGGFHVGRPPIGPGQFVITDKDGRYWVVIGEQGNGT